MSAIPDRLAPLALVAAALAIVLPWRAAADHSDLLLALLVAATALGIGAPELAGLRHHALTVLVLSVLPLIAITAEAWLISRPFGPQTRDGLLAVGVSSSEIASVGLVALAGADVAIALGAVTGSLVTSALVGPLLLAPLAGSAAHGHAGSVHLLARFALVVLAPLAAGVMIRSLPVARERLRGVDSERDGVAALAVVALVYAAVSGTHGGHGLLAAALAALALLIVSAALGELWRRTVADRAAVAGALTIAMRDFAVAAALAQQAFGSRAGAVPGVYGVLMLVGGAVAASRLGTWRRTSA